MEDVRYYYKYICFICGAAWIGSAVCSFFDSIIASVFHVIFAVIAVLATAVHIYWMHRSNSVSFDEMAEANMKTAKACAFEGLQIAICLFIIAMSLLGILRLNIVISGIAVAMFALGLGELIVGIRFLSVEKNGDCQ